MHRKNTITTPTDYRAHYERLNKELPLMRAENKRLMSFIQDASAFLHTDLDDSTKLATLAHDLSGLANDERCFVPRVNGYATR